MTSSPIPDSPPALGDGQHIELGIGGMTCASCVARIERRLNKLPDVTATVNLATEKASISYPAGVTPDELITAIQDIGYAATLPKPTPHRRFEFRGRRGCGLRRAHAVAAAADAGDAGTGHPGDRAGDDPAAAVHLLAVGRR